jgi:tetratricopeptide (TPR) repeat protein
VLKTLLFTPSADLFITLWTIINQAVKLEPKNIEAYFARAAFYINIEERAKAIEDYSRIISLDSNQTYVYLYRADAYYMLREYNKARKITPKPLD